MQLCIASLRHIRFCPTLLSHSPNHHTEPAAGRTLNWPCECSSTLNTDVHPHSHVPADRALGCSGCITCQAEHSANALSNEGGPLPNSAVPAVARSTRRNQSVERQCKRILRWCQSRSPETEESRSPPNLARKPIPIALVVGGCCETNIVLGPI